MQSNSTLGQIASQFIFQRNSCEKNFILYCLNPIKGFSLGLVRLKLLAMENLHGQ